MVAWKAMFVRMNQIICVQKTHDIRVECVLEYFTTDACQRYRPKSPNALVPIGSHYQQFH